VSPGRGNSHGSGTCWISLIYISLIYIRLKGSTNDSVGMADFEETIKGGVGLK